MKIEHDKFHEQITTVKNNNEKMIRKIHSQHQESITELFKSSGELEILNQSLENRNQKLTEKCFTLETVVESKNQEFIKLTESSKQAISQLEEKLETAEIKHSEKEKKLLKYRTMTKNLHQYIQKLKYFDDKNTKNQAQWLFWLIK